jgi:hypothetical protein
MLGERLQKWVKFEGLVKIVPFFYLFYFLFLPNPLSYGIVVE